MKSPIKNRRTVEYAGIALLFAVAIAYQYGAVLPFKPGLLRSHLDQLLHVWILGWDGFAFIHDPFGIFNADINYPAPNTLALSDHLFGIMPFRLETG